MYKYKCAPSVSIDRAVKSPYKCFCCNDSGIVQMTDKQYDCYIDGDLNISLICNRKGCEEGGKYTNSYYAPRSSENMIQSEYQSNFSIDFPGYVCDQIHQEKYLLWGEMIKNQDRSLNRAVTIANAVENLANFNF